MYFLHMLDSGPIETRILIPKHASSLQYTQPTIWPAQIMLRSILQRLLCALEAVAPTSSDYRPFPHRPQNDSQRNSTPF